MGLAKEECSIPSSRAFSFIRATKPLTLPPTCWATATAASFPEHSSTPYNSVSSVRVSPSVRYMAEPSVYAASRLTFTLSWRSPSSMATSAVRILVVLAMSIFRSALCS